MAEQGSYITVPTMILNEWEGPYFSLPHNDPLVVKLKVANALICWILINTESSIDIITWDCLKILKNSGREIVPLIHPILGFGGQEANPIRVIRLLLRFRDKSKARNLEVNFLVVDVLIAYNVILKRLTLHRYEADDGSAEKLQGDQRMTWECYLVSIWPLVERSSGRRLTEQPSSYKKPQITLPPPIETMTICTLTSGDLGRPCQKLADGLEVIPLDKGQPNRIVQIGREIDKHTRRVLISL
ncbi:hypothetical protein Cgig2_004334 [Carnegiea gigantea]|uniref:Uncharacterized protein n=1 Tax=Carnegiea gigantea TaxID=171969 RepID=A0A9Q1JYL9_9CARY|nr:hypothetical protein Cgig2_004334 [Carnegiea gigantea]